MQKLMLSLATFFVAMLTGGVAFAQTGAAAGTWATPLGVAIAMGLAAAGGALGQSRTASAALEGIARNPQASDKVFVPMILGLAFIESLVLFTFVLMLIKL